MNSFKYFVLLTLVICSCNHVDKKESGQYFPKNNFLADSIITYYPKAEVAILGTFHFKANYDSYKRRFHLDVKSEEVQKELENLNNRLKKFQPTKILVEYPRSKQSFLDSLYQEYRANNYELGSNEIFQLGFRLAKSLKHDHIYAVDVQAPLHLEYELPMEDWGSYAEQTGHSQKMNHFFALMEDYHRRSDSLKTTMPLIEYYAYLNSKDATTIAGYEKLSGFIELGANDKYVGADGITMDYRRNLRIYANVLSLIEHDRDRFLMIYGSNHKFILEHLFNSSLEFNLLDIDGLLSIH